MIRQEDIYLKNTIVHILDSTVGMPVLSDTELEHGSDFADFIKAHIAKITSGDDLKSCSFSEDSVVRGYLDAVSYTHLDPTHLALNAFQTV